MRALLRKNLWTGIGSGDWIVLALAVALSITDGIFHAPDGIFFAAMVFVILVGQAVGSSVFSTDLKEENIRFLEYLPLRRSHIWLANWLWGLIMIVALIAALTWHRAIWWHPTDPNDTLRSFEHGDDIQRLLFSKRWSLPLTIASLMFWGYAMATYWRIFVQRETLTTIPNMLTSILFMIALGSLPLAMLVTPLPHDLLPIALASALLFSAAGCLAFTWMPPWWSALRRFGMVALPLFVPIFVLSVLLIAWRAISWSRLDPETSDRMSLALPRIDEGHALAMQSHVIVEVNSLRSREHYFAVNVDSNEKRYLGRGLTFWTGRSGWGQAAQSVPGPGRILAQLETSPDGIYARPATLGCVDFQDMTGGRAAIRPIAHLRGFLDTDGRKYDITDWACTDECTTLLEALEVWRNDDLDRSHVLFVLDPSGHTKARLPLPSDYVVGTAWLASRSGRVMTIGSQPIKPPNFPRICTMYDAAHDRRWEVLLPGMALHTSDDLSVAVCSKGATRGESYTQSIVTIDLDTGAEKTIVESTNRDAPVATAPTVSPDSNPSGGAAAPAAAVQAILVPHQSRSSGLADVILDADPDCRQAVWFATRVAGRFQETALIHLDLRSGATRAIVPESDLPRVALLRTSSYTRGATPGGFTSDGAGYVYVTDNAIYRVNLCDGRRDEIARRSADASDYAWSPLLSPGCLRALVVQSHPPESSAASKPKDRARPICDAHVFEAGHAPAILYSCDAIDVPSVQWFDDDRLVLTWRDKVEIVKADGSGRRAIFTRADCRSPE